MPKPAMIDRIQASPAQTECGAKPEVCSAHVAPLSARLASTRCMAMPMMTMKSSASPTAFSSTRRKGGENNWARALATASSMGKEVGVRGEKGKDSPVARATVEDYPACASSRSPAGTLSAGTSDTIKSGSVAGRSAQAIAL